MFRVFKPKNIVRVKAVQVTTENVKELATLLMGRVDFPAEGVTELAVPTFDGIMRFEMGQWVLRSDDNVLSFMTDEDFKKNYEVARNTAGS